MKKGVIGLAVLFSISLLPAYSATTPKTGATCSKQGITKTYKGKKYTCIKSGKKLVWNKGVAIKTATPQVMPIPTPTISPTTTPIPTTYGTFLDIDSCKLKDLTVNKTIQMISSGFERFTYERYQNPLRISVIVLPVSFLNSKFNSLDLIDLRNELEKVSRFYFTQSYGRAQIDFTIPPESSWVSLPNATSFYNLDIEQNSRGLGNNLTQDILLATKADLGLSNFDIVGIETKRDSSFRFAGGTMLPLGSFYQSPSGMVKNVFGGGGTYAGDWRVIAHELGHNWLGFEDLYNHFDGSFPLGDWDLMSSLNNLELNGWHRWAAGWLQNEQIYCLKRDTRALLDIYSLNSNSKRQLISIPTQTGKSLFIEYRTQSEYFLGERTVLVYFVDTSIWHGSGPYKLVATLKKVGDYVEIDNQRIQIQKLLDEVVYLAMN